MSASPFLIMALPRSRTSWCAAFFNGAGVSCQHDGIRYSETVAGLISDLRQSTKPHAGDSDSGLLFHWKDVHRAGVPTLFIHRPFGEVAESLRRLNLDDSVPVLFDTYQDARGIKSRYIMHVPFDGLDDEDTMRVVWKHLCPNALWDPERYRLFRGLRINVDVSKYALEGQR